MSQISVNGKTMQTLHQALPALLDELGLNKGRYAVEVDGELIPKSQLDNVTLQDGMVIEVVQAVGGG
ncbi:sulfur carrier protein ThiS [Psychrobacter sp. I-STPA6b]|uniref:sulfur carrier protein ThiS n=1 Tax=Psychrobacter sp. I-STPA6b TaxID=2585718 RepID=UPI001D0C7719|nr:sulfur carrier protein ThiS [Psychrobacter sp. I-STPA6b]